MSIDSKSAPVPLVKLRAPVTESITKCATSVPPIEYEYGGTIGELPGRIP